MGTCASVSSLSNTIASAEWPSMPIPSANINYFRVTFDCKVMTKEGDLFDFEDKTAHSHQKITVYQPGNKQQPALTNNSPI